jgi:hypothetical protein
MPKMASKNKVKKSELPDTLKRSPAKAQRQFAKTHDAAADQYGEGERAYRTAYASLKHNFEKVGDHWEAKDEPGPSDPRSTKPTAEKRRGKGETFGGVDAEGNTKRELYERARRLSDGAFDDLVAVKLIEAQLGHASLATADRYLRHIAPTNSSRPCAHWRGSSDAAGLERRPRSRQTQSWRRSSGRRMLADQHARGGASSARIGARRM